MDEQKGQPAHIKKGNEYSKNTLCKLRKGLSQETASGIAVVCGSYGRREAFEHSDLDYFVVSDSERDGQDLGKSTEHLQRKLKLKAPASGGAFARILKQDELIKNIGGDDDSNRNITQRILLLLEGDWLFGEAEFRKLQRSILDRYIRKEIPDHHLTLFLLNDIIRYWRTVCVDYEHKITQRRAWAPRNIKLVFSRKLLYASGLFSVALTVDLSREKKIAQLDELFSLPVIDRMTQICGERAMMPALKSYDRFLSCMACEKSRQALEALQDRPEDRRDHLEFREMKNEGYRFTRELLKLFETTFHSTHPIRRAIVY